MDFQLTREQCELQETARRFAQEEMKTVAEELETEAKPLPKIWLERYAAMGFLGINVAEDLGGMGLGNVEALLVLEEFSKVSSAVAFPIFESSVGPVKAIESFAQDGLKGRVVPQVCKGQMIVAVSMSEPEAGTALTDLKTRAEIKGETIVLNGDKLWCSGGGHS